MTLPIVLASSSVYRKALLSQIVPEFLTCSPDIDESPLESEKPDRLAERLAIEKANAVSVTYPQHLIIGSDQVAFLNDEIIGKPNNHDNAVRQLKRSSGSILTLYTGLALINASTQSIQSTVDCYEVEFRDLTDSQIEQYLATERPYDCCGSLKAEGLGISLLKRLSGKDPNTLIGLPLIELTSMLQKEGFDPVFENHQASFPSCPS